MRRSSNGFSLIEAAIVLGIVGLVIGGIWVAASKVNFSRQISETVTAVLAVQEAVREIFNKGNLPTPPFTVHNMMIQKYIPPGWLNQGGIAGWKLPGGGTFGMGFSTPGTLLYDVVFTDVPATWCEPLVTQVAANFKNRLRLYRIRINFSVSVIDAFPVAPGTSGCPNDGLPVDVLFYFQL